MTASKRFFDANLCRQLGAGIARACSYGSFTVTSRVIGRLITVRSAPTSWRKLARTAGLSWTRMFDQQSQGLSHSEMEANQTARQSDQDGDRGQEDEGNDRNRAEQKQRACPRVVQECAGRLVSGCHGHKPLGAAGSPRVNCHYTQNPVNERNHDVTPTIHITVLDLPISVDRS